MTIGNIYLIGMMGSGKSAVAKALAEILDLACVDIDVLIEEKSGQKINQIFAERGESYFRGLESACLEEVSVKQGFVVATGGGIVTIPVNNECMRGSGIVVFLTASLDVLFERLAGSTERPLIQYEDWQGRVASLLTDRLPLYEETAHITVSTDGNTPEQSARLVAEALEDINA